MTEAHIAIAGLLVRSIAGILFFFQGYDKLFNIKMEEVVNTFMQDAQSRNIPRPVVAFISYLTSLIELLCGFTLIAGAFITYSALLLGLDLVLISFAFSVVQPVWDTRHVFPRLVLIVTLLLLPAGAHLFSLDTLLTR